MMLSRQMQSLGIEKDPVFVEIAQSAISRLTQFNLMSKTAGTPNSGENGLFPLD